MQLCGVAISNVLSLLTCFLELMFYSGTVWGFSFLEYIFKEEKIFEKEKCENVDPAGNFKIFEIDFSPDFLLKGEIRFQNHFVRL